MSKRTWNLVVVLGLAGVLATTACGYSEEEWQAKLAEINDLQDQLAQRDQKIQADEERIGELTTERDSLQGQVRDLFSQAGQLEANLTEIQRLYDEARRQQEQQAARLAAFRATLEKFRAMIESGRLRVRFVGGRMIVEMASNVLFPSGSAELSEMGRQTLSELAAVLMTIPDRTFQVAGHTDDVPMGSGRFKDNWELSTERALSVVRFLQEVGVRPTVLGAVGYGEFQPVGDNTSESGREQNRRIEVVLMPNLDELPDLSALEAEAQ
ncbi:MAG: OmpA family protein [Deltaproteobacteria bacterium]|nr:OmpA family protein [Deltaproteobacteria bacterium]